jgi:hypothetical protein
VAGVGDLGRGRHGRLIANSRRSSNPARRQLDDAVAKPSRVEIAERLAAFREATGDRTAGSVGDLLKESRRERMRQLTGLDADM